MLAKKLARKWHLSWLHHNHRAYSGNVPPWADWKWPKSKDVTAFKTHFYCLLIGKHPAGGSHARCLNLLCKKTKEGPVFNHHYFECMDNYNRNCCFFRSGVRSMYGEYVGEGHKDIPKHVIDRILEKPCGMWVGLLDPCLFDVGLKLKSIHEIHRIVTLASVLSWGRFYSVP